MNESKSEKLPVGPLQDRLTDHHQVIFADQAVAIGYGPFVSRITFGVENHLAGERTPVMTVTMPTNMMHALARNIVNELESASAKQNITKGHQDYIGGYPTNS